MYKKQKYANNIYEVDIMKEKNVQKGEKIRKLKKDIYNTEFSLYEELTNSPIIEKNRLMFNKLNEDYKKRENN